MSHNPNLPSPPLEDQGGIEVKVRGGVPFIQIPAHLCRGELPNNTLRVLCLLLSHEGRFLAGMSKEKLIKQARLGKLAFDAAVDELVSLGVVVLEDPVRQRNGSFTYTYIVDRDALWSCGKPGDIRLLDQKLTSQPRGSEPLGSAQLTSQPRGLIEEYSLEEQRTSPAHASPGTNPGPVDNEERARRTGICTRTLRALAQRELDASKANGVKVKNESGLLRSIEERMITSEGVLGDILELVKRMENDLPNGFDVADVLERWDRAAETARLLSGAISWGKSRRGVETDPDTVLAEAMKLWPTNLNLRQAALQAWLPSWEPSKKPPKRLAVVR